MISFEVKDVENVEKNKVVAGKQQKTDIRKSKDDLLLSKNYRSYGFRPIDGSSANAIPSVARTEPKRVIMKNTRNVPETAIVYIADTAKTVPNKMVHLFEPVIKIDRLIAHFLQI